MTSLLPATIASRSLPATLLAFQHVLFPTFDSAAPQFLLRWDAVHFIHVARAGYVYEHEWAWFPAIPFLLSFSKFAPTIISIVVASDMTATMYALSLHHLQSPALARLATLLSLLPSSPATLFVAPYTELLYTYFSYKGMLSCAKSHYLLASLYFTAAAAFRANGFLLVGFLIWGIALQPLLERKKIYLSSVLVTCGALSALPFIPFVAHNYAAFSVFCKPDSGTPWCTHRVPLIYPYVQGQYWNVGLFRYWTLQQLPNILLGAPPLVALFLFSIQYMRSWMRFDASKHTSRPAGLAPHAIHALIMPRRYPLPTGQRPGCLLTIQGGDDGGSPGVCYGGLYRRSCGGVFLPPA
ncbi:GPI mannosyltransferase 2 [Mycena kentingensis (nom. inval.)]|nr:GPI mannosyltransferase 2 [Mycena kentingensis (nom. inval.)]